MWGVQSRCESQRPQLTRCTQTMKMRGWGRVNIKPKQIKLTRPSENWKVAECPRLQSRSHLNKSGSWWKAACPEFVEPKQLKQTRVLVKHARLTAKRSAARPNEKSKATSESAQKGRRASNTRRSQVFETRPPKKEDGGGAKPISELMHKGKNRREKEKWGAPIRRHRQSTENGLPKSVEWQDKLWKLEPKPWNYNYSCYNIPYRLHHRFKEGHKHLYVQVAQLEIKL